MLSPALPVQKLGSAFSKLVKYCRPALGEAAAKWYADYKAYYKRVRQMPAGR